MEEDLEEWIKVIKSVCLLAGDWIGYEDSPNEEIKTAYKKVMRQTALALREKARILLIK
jgi:hypothetical protein